jgi:hypothetical protein
MAELSLPPNKELCCPVKLEDSVRAKCVGALIGESFILDGEEIDGLVACPILINRRRAFHGQLPVSQDEFEQYAQDSTASVEESVRTGIESIEELLNEEGQG